MAKARTAKTGTLAAAVALQQENGVRQEHRGFWFHSSKDKRTYLVEHPDPTFFSRSPHGWTGWGGQHNADPILVGVIVEPLSQNSVLRAPFVPAGGDKDGFENNRPLLGWWLVLANEDIEKVMIVDQYSQSAAQQIKPYSDASEYIELRKQAVKMTAAANQQREAILKQAKAAQQQKLE